MSELLLELFSEEIPARLQAKAAEDLKAKALEAGCDTVMPRSAFSANLVQIFAQRISNTPNATPS